MRQPTLPSSRLIKALGLVLSASALTGLVYVETVSARPDVEQLDELDDLDDLAELDEPMPTPIAVIPTAAPPAPEAPVVAAVDPSALAVATTRSATTETETEAEAIEPPAPTLVMVPDLSGMRLDKARRELRQLGLRMVARDSYGERIERSWQRDYKVRRQTIEAGTEVEPGTKVRIKARERFVATKGY